MDVNVPQMMKILRDRQHKILNDIYLEITLTCAIELFLLLEIMLTCRILSFSFRRGLHNGLFH